MLETGNKKGGGNTKNSNKYLSWAYVEAANFMRRYCEDAKIWHQRKASKKNKKNTMFVHVLRFNVE